MDFRCSTNEFNILSHLASVGQGSAIRDWQQPTAPAVESNRATAHFEADQEGNRPVNALSASASTKIYIFVLNSIYIL